MTKLYLVRHIETEANVKQTFQGSSDTPPSELGKQQLVWLRDRFASIPYDVLYTSPLKRALITAEALNEGHNCPVVVAKEVEEFDGGDLEGYTLKAFQENYPELFETMLNNTAEFSAPSGETVRELYDRIHTYMDQVVRENRDKTVVLVGHGLALRTYICYLRGYEVGRINEVDLGQNTAVTYVEFDENDCPNIQYINDNSHIPDEHRRQQQNYFELPEEA